MNTDALSARTMNSFVVACALCLLGQAAAERGMDVVVHRGANEEAPENTRAAAQRCIDLGVAYVELDVRRSLEGVMYILHDPNVDRTTDGSGALRAMTSEAIDRLDAGSWFGPEFSGERIPRLEPYLSWIKGRIKVYLDVKDADIETLTGLVRKLEMEDECFFWFGDKHMARAFREKNPRLMLKVNAYTPEQVERAHTSLAPQIIETNLKSMTPEFVKACRDHGMQIMIRQGTNDPATFEAIARSKATLVNLDHPEAFMAVHDEVFGGRALN